MAKFKSIVTDGGSEALTALIASGQKLILTRAAAGSGVAQVSPNTLTDLVNVENVSANLSEKELVEGSPSIMQIPVQVTTKVWNRMSGSEKSASSAWTSAETKFFSAMAGLTAKTATTSFRLQPLKRTPTQSTFTTWPSLSPTRKRRPCLSRWASVPL